MPERFYDTRPRLADNSFQPLTGGLLNFYEVGTLNRKDTYSDAALSTPNANPVVLLSGGLTPNIYLDGAYRVVLTDADGVQIYDIDNVNSGSGASFDAWSSAIEYDSGAIVTGSDGNYYVSQEDNNLNHDPVDATGEWEQFSLIQTDAAGATQLAVLAEVTSTNVGRNLLALTNPGAITFLRVNADNTVTALSAANFRTAIGGTTAGSNIFGLTDPGAVTFLRINADNTVTARSASELKTDLGLVNNGLVLLSTASASGDAAIDFTSGIDSTYDEYEIHLLNVIPATDAAALYMRTSANGGGAWDSGASDYSAVYQSADHTFTEAASAAQMALVVNVGSDANEVGASLVVRVSRPSEATYTLVSWSGGYVTGSGLSSPSLGSGQRRSAAAVDGVRFLFSSGNVESGLFKLYGVRKS